MKLTFPKSYKLDEIRPLYDEYRQLRPELYEEWVRIEHKARDIGPDELLEIQKDVYKFLSEKAEWDNHLALAEVFVDFRKFIIKEHLGYQLGSEGR